MFTVEDVGSQLSAPAALSLSSGSISQTKHVFPHKLILLIVFYHSNRKIIIYTQNAFKKHMNHVSFLGIWILLFKSIPILTETII